MSPPQSSACGQAAHTGFQFEDVPGAKLNVGCGRDVRPRSLGWTNMDVFAPVADMRHDVTSTPWPLRDNSFALVYASHVLEHVPVLIQGGRDVLFRIFDEMYRVLRPGGVVVVRVPVGHGPGGRAHPQHYRQFQPAWFRFLEAGHHEDYYVERHWRIRSIKTTRAHGVRDLVFDGRLPIGSSGIGLTSHIVTRIPATVGLLTRPGEIVAVLEKPASEGVHS